MCVDIHKERIIYFYGNDNQKSANFSVGEGDKKVDQDRNKIPLFRELPI